MKMHPWWRYMVVVAALALFAGCRSSPARLENPLAFDSVRQQFIDRHQRQARRFEVKGALREAKREWQLVHALSSAGNDAGAQLERLDRKIDRQFTKRLAAAERAIARRQGRAARTHLLQALALKPDDNRAIALMRSNEAQLEYAGLDREPTVARGEVSEADVYLAAHDRPGQGKRKRQPAAASSSKAAGAESGGAASGVDARIKQGLKHLSREQYENALAIFERAQGAGGKQDPRLQS